MNVIRSKKTHYSFTDKIIYATAVIVCLLCLSCIIYVELSSDTSLVEMLDASEAEETSLGTKTNEEIETLKTLIKNKFTNSIEKKSATNNVKKIDNTKDIVCTGLDTKKSSSGNYEVNVVLPIINIKSNLISKYNKQIEDVFENKLNSILATSGKNIVYSTEYVASVNNNILSIMIRSNLKEGSKAQRTIIQTYNYDIAKDEEITLQDMLAKNNLDEKTINQTIKNEIEKSEQNVQVYKDLGYPVYSRTPTDKKYQVQNSKQFYCTSNTIYIIYAYGNEDYTNEVDVVVI